MTHKCPKCETKFTETALGITIIEDRSLPPDSLLIDGKLFRVLPAPGSEVHPKAMQEFWARKDGDER